MSILTRGEMTDMVFNELRSAESLHPNWPTNIFEALAVVQEGVGELAQACLGVKHKGASEDRVFEEAVQVAAMGLRFLFNLCEES